MSTFDGSLLEVPITLMVRDFFVERLLRPIWSSKVSVATGCGSVVSNQPVKKEGEKL
jgi:hypothetical protein